MDKYLAKCSTVALVVVLMNLVSVRGELAGTLSRDNGWNISSTSRRGTGSLSEGGEDMSVSSSRSPASDSKLPHFGLLDIPSLESSPGDWGESDLSKESRSKLESLRILLWDRFKACNLRLSSDTFNVCFWRLAMNCSWWASYSSREGWIFMINMSKLGSGRRERLEISFFRQVGHSLFPLLRAVMIQSWQNRWRHSLVVMVSFNISKQMGHINSLWRDLGATAISVSFVITSWGCLCNSYGLSSHALLDESPLIILAMVDEDTAGLTPFSPRHSHTLGYIPCIRPGTESVWIRKKDGERERRGKDGERGKDREKNKAKTKKGIQGSILYFYLQKYEIFWKTSATRTPPFSGASQFDTLIQATLWSMALSKLN